MLKDNHMHDVTKTERMLAELRQSLHNHMLQGSLEYQVLEQIIARPKTHVELCF